MRCKSTHVEDTSRPNLVENRLSGEVNVESILALEERIREHEKTLSKLKRSRNALLNISALPPEILGNIFQCNVTLKYNFGGLEEGSHNFLFVCHHWREVALRTPGVWSFWGNTLEDWTRWHRHSGTAPLDLVLDAGCSDDDNDIGGDGPFDVALHGTLQDRAARDTIRRIHLSSEDTSLLSSIISSLTTVCEGVRSNSVESLILSSSDDEPVDISEFFARYRFPKLQYLRLDSCRITSWDLLTSRTTVLATLSLHFHNSSPTPTTSQLLSILTSNPTLRKLELSGHAIPNDGGGEPPLRVLLHHLKEVRLDGGLQHVLGLLHRLDHPEKMDRLDITLSECASTDIPKTIGPYLRDHFRRRGRSRDGVGLRVSQFENTVVLYVGDMCGASLPIPGIYDNWFVSVAVELPQTPGDLLEKRLLDLITHTPRDDVVRFESTCWLRAVEDISARFPNLRQLHFHTGTISLPTILPKSTAGGEEGVLPSLQRIEFVSRPDGGDWSPLTAFLTRRASFGHRLGLLVILGCHVCPEVAELIRSAVQELRHDFIENCPFGICPE